MKMFRLHTAAIVLLAAAMPVQAADYLRHYDSHRLHHRSRSSLDTYAGEAYASDRACTTFAPSVYKPRMTNFNEPLCYAARPYGISTHLYDRSTLLEGHANEY